MGEHLSLANFAIVFGSLLNIAVQTAVGGSTQRMAVFGVMTVLPSWPLQTFCPSPRCGTAT
ncbi:MAG: hypothetical protein ACI36V_08375 [Coriobacteriales bacterium]